MPGQQRYVHRGAVPVHNVQIAGRIIPVDAAFAAQRSGDAHAQHAFENSFFIIVFQTSVFSHEVFMHMDIHETGRYHQARCVNDPVRCRLVLGNGHNPAVV